MKIILQRVARGSVQVDGRTTGAIGHGYVALVGIKRGDVKEDAHALARKTAALRILPDGEGKMNRSLLDCDGEVLAISQFTLYADTRKGHRPGFSAAAPPEVARELYEDYVEALRRELGPDRVKTGVFQAQMRVEIINDGPVTLELSSETRSSGSSTN